MIECAKDSGHYRTIGPESGRSVARGGTGDGPAASQFRTMDTDRLPDARTTIMALSPS